MEKKLLNYSLALLCVFTFSVASYAQFIDQYDYENIGVPPANHDTSANATGTTVTIQQVSPCGGNMLVLTDNATPGGLINTQIPFSGGNEIGDGEFIYFRVDIEAKQLDLGLHIDLRDGGVPIIKFTLGANGIVQPFDNTTAFGIGSYSDNIVHRVEIIGDYDNRVWTLKFDGNDVIDPNTSLPKEFGFRGTSGRPIDNIRLLTIGGAHEGEFYIDKMIVSDQPISGSLLPLDPDAPGTCESSLSVNDEILQATKLYPNPTTGKISLESRGYIDKVELFNITGKKVNIDYKAQSRSVDISNLATGLYYLKVSKEDASKVFKVVKQ